MKKLLLSCKDLTYLVAHTDIIYCKSDNSYTHIFTIHEGILVTSKAIYKLQEELQDKNFIRVGQSYLVNRIFISKIDKRNKLLILTNEDTLPYSIKIGALLDQLKWD